MPGADVPGRLIEENLWRAIRYGPRRQAASTSSAARSTRRREAVERLVAWTAPVRAELGIELGRSVPNGAQRQRRLIEAGVAMEEVFAGDRARDA